MQVPDPIPYYGSFWTGFQGTVDLLSSKEHSAFSSQRLLTLPELCSQASSGFYFFSPATENSAARPCHGEVLLGKGWQWLPFSFNLDFHPMAEATALSLVSQISNLIFGT